MTLRERLAEYIRACFTGLWINSYEHEDALQEIAELCRLENWRLAIWDIDRGLRVARTATEEPLAADPVSALRAAGTLADIQQPLLVVFKNLHRFLQSAELVQVLWHHLVAGKQQRVYTLVLAPLVQIPHELEKQFVVIDHELPSREQLWEIARGIASEPAELPAGTALEQVLDAGSGLTRYEAEGAFSLALVRHEQVEPQTIWELKAQTLLKAGMLSLHRGGETFADLGGLESLKSFCKQALRPRAGEAVTCRPRGVLLLGVAGSGKSAFCKALGQETGRPTLVLDVGSLLGSLVGQTEERTRHALRIVDAMQPAVLMIDEVEKALGGTSGASPGDSGVATRMLGTLLSWLNDHTSDVFVVCTANDVTRLPPEFSRAERFDGIFFLDLPDATEKQQIWQQYLRHYGLKTDQPLPGDFQWTGAEIKSCCRLALLLGVPLLQAAQNVVPVAVTASESVERLRQWASGRCLSADVPGIYTRTSARKARGRPIGGDPLLN